MNRTDTVKTGICGDGPAAGNPIRFENDRLLTRSLTKQDLEGLEAIRNDRPVYFSFCFSLSAGIRRQNPQEPGRYQNGPHHAARRCGNPFRVHPIPAHPADLRW